MKFKSVITGLLVIFLLAGVMGAFAYLDGSFSVLGFRAKEDAESTEEKRCEAFNCNMYVEDEDPEAVYCYDHECQREGCHGYRPLGALCSKHSKEVQLEQERERALKEAEEQARNKKEREEKIANCICLADGCEAPMVSKGQYCGKHTCDHPFCDNEVTENSNYCYSHRPEKNKHSNTKPIGDGYDRSDYSDYEDFYEDNDDELDSYDDAEDEFED